MRKIKEAINNIFEKHTDKMLVFVVTNMIIAVVWYIVELFTIGGI